MHGDFSKSINGRAVLAIVAIYAFFLQTFLAAALPLPSFDPANIICGSSTAPAAPGHHGPLTHQHPCCTAAHLDTTLPSPPISFGLITLRQPDEIVVWTGVDVAPKTGPPTRSHSARSPPVV